MAALLENILKCARAICALFFLVLAAVSFSKVDAQIYKAYKKLSVPEKRWVLFHPLAAKKTYNVSSIVNAEVIKCTKNKDFDGDGTGGSLDAFKHTLWMALCSQKIGARKAILLGKAHEAGNRLQFEACGGKKLIDQDSVLSRMDMLNNEIGAALGEKHNKASYDEIVEIVKKNVLEGNCYKIKKDSKRHFLDINGDIIDPKKYIGVWNVPKVIIKSNE